MALACLLFWQFASNFFEVCQPVCRPIECQAPCPAPHQAPCHPAFHVFESCSASDSVPTSTRTPQPQPNQSASASAAARTRLASASSRQELASLSKEQLEAIFLDHKEAVPRRMQAFDQLRVLHTLLPHPSPRSELSPFQRAFSPTRFPTPKLPGPLKSALSRIDPRQTSPPRERAHRRSKSPQTALVADLVSKSPSFESFEVE